MGKIRLDTGEKIELQINNTRFDDAMKEVIVLAISEIYFIVFVYIIILLDPQGGWKKNKD